MLYVMSFLYTFHNKYLHLKYEEITTIGIVSSGFILRFQLFHATINEEFV